MQTLIKMINNREDPFNDEAVYYWYNKFLNEHKIEETN